MALRNRKSTNNLAHGYSDENKKEVNHADSFVDEILVPEEKPKHIPKSEIIDYIGKKVWYDLRERLDEGGKPLYYSLGVHIITDVSGGKIHYIDGWDFLAMYENRFVFWAEKPDDETRKNDRWDFEGPES